MSLTYQNHDLHDGFLSIKYVALDHCKPLQLLFVFIWAVLLEKPCGIGCPRLTRRTGSKRRPGRWLSITLSLPSNLPPDFLYVNLSRLLSYFLARAFGAQVGCAFRQSTAGNDVVATIFIILFFFPQFFFLLRHDLFL